MVLDIDSLYYDVFTCSSGLEHATYHEILRFAQNDRVSLFGEKHIIAEDFLKFGFAGQFDILHLVG